MNSLLFAIILIPAVEIYLFIKIGAVIGAFKTVILIFFTAFIGIYYARAEGLNTLNNGLKKMFKNNELLKRIRTSLLKKLAERIFLD